MGLHKTTEKKNQSEDEKGNVVLTFLYELTHESCAIYLEAALETQDFFTSVENNSMRLSRMMP